MKKGIFFILFLMTCLASAFSAVVVNIIAVNPSENEERTVKVKQYLPEEISSENVLDAGDLSVDYDVSEGKHFVYGEIVLKPKESRKFKVVLEDVWGILTAEIEDLLAVVDKKISMSADEDKQTAQVIGDGIKTRLERILSTQEASKDDIEKRMKNYAVNKNTLQTLRDEIFSFERLVKYSMTEEDDETVTLVVEAENILSRPYEAKVKHYLPKEITPETILDDGGMDVKYDAEKARFYLEKTEQFKANEKKRYNVVIKKVWDIGERELDSYSTEATELNEKVKGADEEIISQALYDEIQRNIANIRKSQELSRNIKEYIAAYRRNLEYANEIKSDLVKMKLLKAESQSSATTRQVDQAFKKMDKITSIKMKDVANKLIQKIKQIGVWRIIFVMVIFLIVLTTFFYTIWFLRLKKEEKAEIKEIGTD